MMRASVMSCAVALATLAAGAGSGAGRPKAKPLPPPPFEVQWLPGWTAEHVAFAVGGSGKVFGGPARWAVGGGCPSGTCPADQHGRLYTGREDSDARVYFHDKRRWVWMLQGREVWPLAGGDDLGEVDGPGSASGFLFPGAYGGGYAQKVARGTTLYVMDNGYLRKVDRDEDGTWSVRTVAGRGKRTRLAPGESADLAEFGQLGKGLAIDAAGNLYFPLDGGLVRADPGGKVNWLITPDKANADLAALYARRWPDAKPPKVALGRGETVELFAGLDGAIYGGGRTWPSAWKVTAEGQFVPLVGYGPKERIHSERWGQGDPALYEPHCCMGFSVAPGGLVEMQNEIPYARTRYEADRVVVLRPDGTWGLGKDFFRPPFAAAYSPDGTMVTDGPPGPYPSRTAWIRLRKIE